MTNREFFEDYVLNEAPKSREKPSPDYFLVERETYHELISSVEDPLFPYEDPDYIDDMHFYPTEKSYFLFIIGLLGSSSAIASTLLRKKKYENYGELYGQIDIRLSQGTSNVFTKNSSFIEQFYTMGKRSVGDSFQRQAIFNAADNHALYFLKHHSFGRILGLTDDMKQGIFKSIYEGIGQGKSIPNIAKEIERMAITKPLPIYSKTGKLIRHLSPERRALLIARTETLRARNQALLLGYVQAGITQFNIQTAHDKRVCKYCKVNEAGGPYNLFNLPYLPTHPDCRCVYSPVPRALEGKEFNPVRQYPNLVKEEVMDVPQLFSIGE